MFKLNKSFFTVLSFTYLLTAANVTPSHAFDFRYAHDLCEYSFELPNAPVVSSIWADGFIPIPQITLKGSAEFLGETSSFVEVDYVSKDILQWNSSCMTFSKNSILEFNQLSMHSILKESFKKDKIKDRRLTYSENNIGLKWATITGYSVGANDKLIYHTGHFLTGQESIMLIKAKYTAENKNYSEIFALIQDSIDIN